MSVLIKGMELPKSCVNCRLMADGWCYATPSKGLSELSSIGRPDWCSLIPLPAGHGRLIDADAMERTMSETVQGDIRGYPYSDTQWDMAFRWIDHQPTIVPAEGGSDNV